MGLFDEVRCPYPLNCPEVQDAIFQSKDTPTQYFDQYEIRVDGTLWHEAFDHRDNVRWEQVMIDGEIEIHHAIGEAPNMKWYSFRFWFRDGVVRDMIAKVPE